MVGSTLPRPPKTPMTEAQIIEKMHRALKKCIPTMHQDTTLNGKCNYAGVRYAVQLAEKHMIEDAGK